MNLFKAIKAIGELSQKEKTFLYEFYPGYHPNYDEDHTAEALIQRGILQKKTDQWGAGALIPTEEWEPVFEELECQK